MLCGADVSLLIFSSAGKAFEFSSKDLDTEFDRYLEYEGLIERRRAEEFAAMAEADEDDDDDDDDDAPKGKKGKGKGGAAAASEAGDKKPVKTLKGKEVYKVKMPSRREIAAADKKRKRREKSEKGFIENLLSGSEGDDGDRSRDSSVRSLPFLLGRQLMVGHGQYELCDGPRTLLRLPKPLGFPLFPPFAPVLSALLPRIRRCEIRRTRFLTSIRPLWTGQPADVRREYRRCPLGPGPAAAVRRVPDAAEPPAAAAPAALEAEGTAGFDGRQRRVG